MSLRKLLFPVDAADVSRWTLVRAERLLRAPDAAVTLLGVIPATRAEAADPLFASDPRHRPIHDAIALLKKDLIGRGTSAEGRIVFGDPATEILREAATQGHDAVVMSTHGRTGIDRVLFGSVTLNVLQACPLPMILFRPLLHPDGTVSRVEPDLPARFENMLIALDGSQVAEEVIPAVEALARAHRSCLHLVTAVPGGRDNAGLRETAERHLARWSRVFATLGIQATHEVREGEAGIEILACAQQRGVDSIALTTHGRTGISRAVYGSVAEKVLSRADVPLLVVKSRIACPHPLEVNGAAMRLGIA